MQTHYYTENSNLVIKIPLPGVDPKDVKLSYLDNRLLINDSYLTYNINDRYDIKSASAELKHGLMVVRIPEFPKNRGEIPIKVLDLATDPESKTPSLQ